MVVILAFAYYLSGKQLLLQRFFKVLPDLQIAGDTHVVERLRQKAPVALQCSGQRAWVPAWQRKPRARSRRRGVFRKR